MQQSEDVRQRPAAVYRAKSMLDYSRSAPLCYEIGSSVEFAVS
jgi:hypothetical protein